jgi:hypothetical protein
VWKLEARPEPSAFWRIASPLLALVLTVILGVLLFMALGKDPVKGLLVFFWEPIRSGYALGELVVKATPLLLIALGLALCFRSNVWNIGAEGQYVMGAVFATGVALLADKSSGAWFFVPVLCAGLLGGMCWAALTAWLRDRFHANEILVSLMLVYVAIMVLGYLVYGPWKDPLGYNFPQTKTFEVATQVPRLFKGSRVNIGAVGVHVPHPRRLGAANWRLVASGSTLRRVFIAPCHLGCAVGVRGMRRFGGCVGSGGTDRSAHPLCAGGLWFCGDHRGVCGALAPGGHGVLSHFDEHVLYRW